ncbi:unnamed protein product [Acanthoscelides obtectus]|uniref:CHCH domain-containing protein n=1 Tax=Acanthoscelides obtectus TaxID=200917 RepID=A0A9P0KIM9_ACAOB|nr:unnamed protein product [Acanthoscelides obtectus]CAK1664754.1 Coiled-coil-helix-coiled-coil-helix domain-containing protein 1 [Acanthoscelides obtectus]
MRLLGALYAARTPAKEPVHFQAILPLKLKPVVSGKGGKTSDVCCIYEMSVMFNCFKDNDFNQGLCGKEIEQFQNCYTNHLSTKRVRKEKELKGILNPGEKKMSAKQINTLLARHPNIE